MKQKLFAMIALLLAFSMVFTGCSSDDRDNKRNDRDDDRVEDRDDRDEDEDDGDSERDDDDQSGIPVYETREVWLCVRATTEQWDGSGSFTWEYTYDEYGNRIREDNVAYGSAMVYTYDENGNQITSQYITTSGSAGSLTEKTYDEGGRILTSISTNSDGTVNSEYYYTYDEEGYLIEEVQQLNYGDQNVYRYVITYNADHTAATVMSYQNDELVGTTEETYDASGNLLTSRTYSVDGRFTSGVDCEYDEAGRISVEWKYSGSELQADYDVIYTYDENGLLVFKDVDYYYGSGTTYEYELMEILVRIN